MGRPLTAINEIGALAAPDYPLTREMPDAVDSEPFLLPPVSAVVAAVSPDGGSKDGRRVRARQSETPDDGSVAPRTQLSEAPPRLVGSSAAAGQPGWRMGRPGPEYEPNQN